MSGDNRPPASRRAESAEDLRILGALGPTRSGAVQDRGARESSHLDLSLWRFYEVEWSDEAALAAEVRLNVRLVDHRMSKVEPRPSGLGGIFAVPVGPRESGRQ